MNKNILSIGIILICFTPLSCQVKTNAKYSIDLFFRQTDWKIFNERTFKKNNLTHFLKENIDVYQRESFFSFMIKNPTNINYDVFYLIEVNKQGERIINKKIFVIEDKESMIFLAFEKNIIWEKYQLSENETKKCVEKIKNHVKDNDESSFTIVTKIEKQTI